MSSLFGGKPSLFGGAPATSAPAQPSLFANLGSNAASSSPAPPAPSLFGGAGGGGAATTTTAAGAAAGAPPTSSLFGSVPKPAQPASTLFGQSSTGTAGVAGAGVGIGGIGGGVGGGAQSLFGNKDAAQKPADPKPRAPEPFHTAYFNNLVEKNKKRARENEEQGLGVNDMPSLTLGLSDLQKRLKELGGGGQTKKDQGSDSKAHYLLAASGVNPGTTMRDLNAFSPQAGFGGTTATAAAAKPTRPAEEWEPDSHRYVEQLQQQTTLKLINEGIERSNREFDEYLQRHVDINWEEQRRKVFEHFGLGRAVDQSLDQSSMGGAGPSMTGAFGRSSRRRGGAAAAKAGEGGPGTPHKSGYGASAFGLQKSVIGTPGVGAPNSQIFSDAKPQSPGGGGAPSFAEERILHEKQQAFAEKVQKLNEARLRNGGSYGLLKMFESVECSQISDSPPQVAEAYKALAQIVQEGDDGQKAKARKFKDDYLNDSPTSAAGINMRRRIIDGSRRALEKQFWDALVSLVEKNPREGRLGGIPSVINQARAYVRIRNHRKDLVPDGLELQTMNEDHCWALIFFLLRGGYIREAATYVTENKTAFQAIDRNFITYITAYTQSPDLSLKRTVQQKMEQEYQQRMKLAPENSLDPYRMACYKIIGRCDLSKRSIDNLSLNTDDWMWLQFALARENPRSEELANASYSLEDLQQTIREIGQRHFSRSSESGGGGYGVFFYLQVLGGMFEAAVDYLYRHSYVSAVHFAIALDYYGLLRVSPFTASDSELLTYTTREQPQINFGRMIGYYTRDFRTANVVAATDYLTLIHLDADLPGELGKMQAQLCHEALRELVLETREFAQLLGDIRYDGVRIRGAIEQRLGLIGITDQEEFLRTVTLQAAGVADDSGRTTDAVLLYHLSEDYDKVISIINRALSDSIAVDIDGEQLRVQPVKPRDPPPAAPKLGGEEEAGARSSFSLTAVDDPRELALKFVEWYNASALFYERIRPAHRDTCGLLLRVADARRKVQARRWAAALDDVAALALLPLAARGSVPAIRAQAQNLAALPSTVSRLVGPLLLWTILCISRQRELLLHGDPAAAGAAAAGAEPGQEPQVFETATKKRMADELVGKAKDLMVFAGLVKLRLGKGVWEGIVGCAGEIGVY